MNPLFRIAAAFAVLGCFLLSGCCQYGALRALRGSARTEVVPFNYASPHLLPGQVPSGPVLRVSGFAVLPRGTERKGIVAVCHGGFSPALSMLDVSRMFAAAGWVVVAPDYRGVGVSNGSVEFADGEVEDIRAAVSYAADTFFPFAKDATVDVRFFGASHGAFNTLLLLSRPPSPDFDNGGRFGLPPSVVVTKAALFAPGFDLPELYDLWKTFDASSPDSEERVGAAVCKGLECAWIRRSERCADPATPSTDRDAYLRRSPSHHASLLPNNVDYLIIHGTDDHLIPIGQAEALRAALKHRGASVDWHPVAGLGHVPQPGSKHVREFGLAAFCFLNSKK